VTGIYEVYAQEGISSRTGSGTRTAGDSKRKPEGSEPQPYVAVDQKTTLLCTVGPGTALRAVDGCPTDLVDPGVRSL
jgi:hypothetical protein